MANSHFIGTTDANANADANVDANALGCVLFFRGSIEAFSGKIGDAVQFCELLV